MAQERPPRESTDRVFGSPSTKDRAAISWPALLPVWPWREGQDTPDPQAEGGLDQMDPHTDATSPHFSTQNWTGQKHDNLCIGELCIFLAPVCWKTCMTTIYSFYAFQKPH